MKHEPKPATPADIQRVFTLPGNARLSIIGAGALTLMILDAGHRDGGQELSRRPEMRPVRLAFSIHDRIRTGELPTWTCSLCERQRQGLAQLSLLAVIDHEGDTAKDPSLTALVCMPCDNVSEEDTVRRVREVFGLPNT